MERSDDDNQVDMLLRINSCSAAVRIEGGGGKQNFCFALRTKIISNSDRKAQ